MSRKNLNPENTNSRQNLHSELQDHSFNTEIHEHSQQQMANSNIQDQIQNQQVQQGEQLNMNPQQNAQWLIQQVQMLNQKKAATAQQGQQPDPQIDQQIYQYQIQYQQIMANQNQQQQQHQQKVKLNQVGIIGGQQQFNNSFNTSKYAGLSEQQKRQKKRQEMASKQKYPRALIPENNESNMDLGGAYQKCLYTLGECLGSLRAVCPCLYCVEYPFKQVDQGQQGIYQRFGKFVKTVGAGLHQINPCTDKLIAYSTKQITYDMYKQFCITKDNILVQVDGQLFYRVVEPRYAHYYCENVENCVIELAYTTIRTIVGHFILQDIFEKKNELTQAIQTFLEHHSWEWGVSIESVMIKEVTPAKDVQDTLNVAAKERRLAESKIISAKTDVQSAKLMREAADILDSDAAMQIRYLETVKKLSATSKVILLGDEDENN